MKLDQGIEKRIRFQFREKAKNLKEFSFVIDSYSLPEYELMKKLVNELCTKLQCKVIKDTYEEFIDNTDLYLHVSTLDIIKD